MHIYIIIFWGWQLLSLLTWPLSFACLSMQVFMSHLQQNLALSQGLQKLHMAPSISNATDQYLYQPLVQ